jgi:hypothetical protein
MATSGNYAFLPVFAEVIIEAFERCGLDPALLTARHFASALRSINLLQVDIENEGDIMFRQDLVRQALTADDTGFLTPVGTLAVVGATWIRNVGDDDERRVELTLISQEEFERIQRPSQSGSPNQYFVSRSLPNEPGLFDDAVVPAAAVAWGPTTTISGYLSDKLALIFWPPTDTTGDVILYNRIRQTQDAENLAQTPDQARQWLEAYHAGLAAKLARKWAPERIQVLDGDYVRALDKAKGSARDRGSIRFGARGIGSPGRMRRN